MKKIEIMETIEQCSYATTIYEMKYIYNELHFRKIKNSEMLIEKLKRLLSIYNRDIYTLNQIQLFKIYSFELSIKTTLYISKIEYVVIYELQNQMIDELNALDFEKLTFEQIKFK